SIERRRTCGGSAIPLTLSTFLIFCRITTLCSAHICVSPRSHLRLAALTFVMSMSHYSHLNHCLPRNASKAPNEKIAFHRCCVDDIDGLKLSYPAAGASESVHLKELFRQDVSQFAN